MVALKKLHKVFDRRPERDVGGFQIDHALFVKYSLHFAFIDENTALTRTDN